MARKWPLGQSLVEFRGWTETSGYAYFFVYFICPVTLIYYTRYKPYTETKWLQYRIKGLTCSSCILGRVLVPILSPGGAHTLLGTTDLQDRVQAPSPDVMEPFKVRLLFYLSPLPVLSLVLQQHWMACSLLGGPLFLASRPCAVHAVFFLSLLGYLRSSFLFHLTHHTLQALPWQPFFPPRRLLG